ncbi:DUF2326 domain-containing protein [Actinosynnema sp. NPDC050801]|uniref:DUF2326 domain-containing protein n=1 Tax=unclassified Actinosynnema TaxID=2637065 RepID=UPI0033CA1F1F
MIFEPLVFNDGMSVVLAEIRVPENRLLDTHNLGKTTVGELIDFCLLKGKSSTFFLFKNEQRFREFTFYLEIALDDGSFLTIGRAVDPGTKIDFLHSDRPVSDATNASVEDWDHLGLSFDRARLLLDGYLKLEALRPWGFRKLVGYLIRSQSDYLDVFQLGKFSGKHQDWKPFVAHLLGMESEAVIALYDKREEAAQATTHLNSVTQEWGSEAADPSVLDGLISVKRRDIEAREKALDTLDFSDDDSRVTAEVVDEIENRISGLNEEKYRLAQLLTRIASSLEEERVIFRPSDAEKLFAEAGITLGEQIKRDYEQLIAFNRAITQERREALERQSKEAQERLVSIDSELKHLNESRARALAYLRQSEALAKYKELSNELTVMRSDLINLENRRVAATRLIELRRQVRTLNEEYGHLVTAVEEQLESLSQNEDSRFGRLRRFFTEIIFQVLGQNAILAMRVNQAGGIDFSAEFIGESGTATSGDKGTSYKKLLCIAFDLALLRTYLDAPFPRFVYHDGALEQLEPRKRESLVRVFREYADLGIQPVISVLDSDVPVPTGSTEAAIDDSDVIALLHDEGDNGRLFKMTPW